MCGKGPWLPAACSKQPGERQPRMKLTRYLENKIWKRAVLRLQRNLAQLRQVTSEAGHGILNGVWVVCGGNPAGRLDVETMVDSYSPHPSQWQTMMPLLCVRQSADDRIPGAEGMGCTGEAKLARWAGKRCAVRRHH